MGKGTGPKREAGCQSEPQRTLPRRNSPAYRVQPLPQRHASDQGAAPTPDGQHVCWPPEDKRRLPESRGSSIALMPEVLRTPSFPLSCFPHPSLNPAPRLCPAVQAVRTEPRRPLAPQQFPRQDAQSSTAGKRDLSQGPEGGEGKEGAKAAGAGTREGVGAQLRSLGSRCRRLPDARQRAFPREPQDLFSINGLRDQLARDFL